jgi:formylglycine-generating enzyme required for sulfatase activity
LLQTTVFLPMLCDANGFDDAELETDGIYVYSNDTIQTTNPIGTQDPFPTMKALWCMKYEITQAAYRDFLNTLDSAQQVTRTSVAVTSVTGTSALSGGTARNFIEIAVPATSTTTAVYGCDANGNNIYNEAGDGEWVACNFLAWVDIAAFLDWSGLAPMSELQYERICRGNTSAGGNAAVLGEYAWGTATIFASNYTLSSANTASEIASNASGTVGNAAYTTTSSAGPLRSGIFCYAPF